MLWRNAAMNAAAGIQGMLSIVYLATALSAIHWKSESVTFWSSGFTEAEPRTLSGNSLHWMTSIVHLSSTVTHIWNIWQKQGRQEKMFECVDREFVTRQLWQLYRKELKVIEKEPCTCCVSRHLFGFLSPFQKIQMQSTICAESWNQFIAPSASTSWFSALTTMKKITEHLNRSVVLFGKGKKLHSAFEKQIWCVVMDFHKVLKVVKTQNFSNLVVTLFSYKTFIQETTIQWLKMRIL